MYASVTMKEIYIHHSINPASSTCVFTMVIHCQFTFQIEVNTLNKAHRIQLSCCNTKQCS